MCPLIKAHRRCLRKPGWQSRLTLMIIGGLGSVIANVAQFSAWPDWLWLEASDTDQTACCSSRIPQGFSSPGPRGLWDTGLRAELNRTEQSKTEQDVAVPLSLLYFAAEDLPRLLHFRPPAGEE